MIYVNGTEMKTVGDLYINGTTPTSVYCNGTLVWTKLVTTTFAFNNSGDGDISATLTYYQQPGDSTKTTSTSSSVSFQARPSTVVSISMTTTGCFYPNSYSSVSPST